MLKSIYLSGENMKTMTCKELGGACDLEFQAETFEDIAEKSKKHGIEMFEKKDKDHLIAMEKMMILMKDSKKMKSWMDEKRNYFESLKED